VAEVARLARAMDGVFGAAGAAGGGAAGGGAVGGGAVGGGAVGGGAVGGGEEGAAVDESGEWYPIDKTFVTGFE
jgi:hypothetical protein